MDQVMTAPTVAITRQQLLQAMTQWEQRHRDGKCRPDAECLAMLVAQVAEESTEYLWSTLSGV